MSDVKSVRSSREIYTDILYRGLLAIRAARDVDSARAIAYHLHNLPHLVQRLEHAGLHDYYWKVERPEFVRSAPPEQSKIFEALWAELELARKVETTLTP